MYEAKNYDNLLGLPGFSDKLLQNHFKLYQGYVKNTNNVIDLLEKEEAGSYLFGELKRRFGWEFNGMRLHELYFENLTNEKKELDQNGEVSKLIEQNFDSFENWKNDFIKTASMRGIGWVVLYYDKNAKKLYNNWINEHDVAHLFSTTPLLIIDVFEHAFITDYELDKASYIQAFFEAINWSVVNDRLLSA